MGEIKLMVLGENGQDYQSRMTLMKLNDFILFEYFLNPKISFKYDLMPRNIMVSFNIPFNNTV
jgi:hypothetical protein